MISSKKAKGYKSQAVASLFKLREVSESRFRNLLVKLGGKKMRGKSVRFLESLGVMECKICGQKFSSKESVERAQCPKGCKLPR